MKQSGEECSSNSKNSKNNNKGLDRIQEKWNATRKISRDLDKLRILAWTWEHVCVFVRVCVPMYTIFKYCSHLILQTVRAERVYHKQIHTYIHNIYKRDTQVDLNANWKIGYINPRLAKPKQPNTYTFTYTHTVADGMTVTNVQ